jgi:hypothetical protein
MSRRPVNRLLTQSPVFSLRHKIATVRNYSIRLFLEAAADEDWEHNNTESESFGLRETDGEGRC